jgi:small subunit ribosomal protein S6
MFYELMMILNPDLGEEEIEKVTARFRLYVTKNGGEIIKIDDLGLKTLSYKIQKKSKGRYFLSYLGGPGSMLSEIERTLKIDENILRFLIIRLEEDIKREDLEKTMAEHKTEAVTERETEKIAVVASETLQGEENHGEN